MVKRVWLLLPPLAAVAAGVLGRVMLSTLPGTGDAALKDIVANPESFEGVRVQLQGSLVNTNVYMFGPPSVLRDCEDEVEIAVGGTGDVALKPCVSLVFDGSNYTKISEARVELVGTVHYIGWVTDSPMCCLGVENAESLDHAVQ